MPKAAPESDLTLAPRGPGISLPQWLYLELREAILSGRLRRGVRLPATRELAAQQRVSRGTVVTAFEQLVTEGYAESRAGAGTFVSARLPSELARKAAKPVRTTVQAPPGPLRPFRVYEPAVHAFPMEVWARIASRRLRKATGQMLISGDPFGFAPLREAVADYLRRSRGVTCRPEQVAIVSGTNQSLDLVLRLLLRPGDPVWLEDPGYTGALFALQQVQARVVPVAVDAEGLDPTLGQKLAPDAKAVYLTPAHQFPLGITMPLQRRLAVLEWARRAGAHILEDDYDSEFRYAAKPVPSLQGLDTGGTVIFMGSFSKMLFTALRLAYVVVPEHLIDPLQERRLWLDRFSPTLDQAILCDFLTEGHLGRHLRRMRALYAARLQCLRQAVNTYLHGALMLPDIQAGLHIPAHLAAGLDAMDIEMRAEAAGVEAWSVGRFVLQRTDVNALLLGFAAFEERAIVQGVRQLAAIVEKPNRPGSRRSA
ncbi:MAG TPA: PLP-dependent aminotransferase family protein [Bryobacteraceae bacterium]|nr:PLP-dependent aminotransferase family protein [Bryobacteraceae bacterium]